MLNDYVCIADTYSNDIFSAIWQKKVNELADCSTLTIEDINYKLWKPAIGECNKLLTALQQRTIKLSEVDNHFSQYQSHMDIAVYNLTRLCKALREIRKCVYNENKIKEAVSIMQQYWSLCKYSSAAKTCLQLKEQLELQGDFGVVKDLALQVCIFLLYYIEYSNTNVHA